jgi:hypothetical protein
MQHASEGMRGNKDGAGRNRREGLLSTILSISASTLEAERDRWFLWVPVLFAAGILSYFALVDEPAMRRALARSA